MNGDDHESFWPSKNFAKMRICVGSDYGPARVLGRLWVPDDLNHFIILKNFIHKCLNFWRYWHWFNRWKLYSKEVSKLKAAKSAFSILLMIFSNSNTRIDFSVRRIALSYPNPGHFEIFLAKYQQSVYLTGKCQCNINILTVFEILYAWLTLQLWKFHYSVFMTSYLSNNLAISRKFKEDQLHKGN